LLFLAEAFISIHSYQNFVWYKYSLLQLLDII
jgi:hypothetical protein